MHASLHRVLRIAIAARTNSATNSEGATGGVRSVVVPAEGLGTDAPREILWGAVDLPEPMARQLGHRLLTNDGDAMVGTFGDVWLAARLLAHPDVAALHHPELFARMQLQARRGSQA
jgi:hypothetical protein